jgi:hypothetical protein
MKPPATWPRSPSSQSTIRITKMVQSMEFSLVNGSLPRNSSHGTASVDLWMSVSVRASVSDRRRRFERTTPNSPLVHYGVAAGFAAALRTGGAQGRISTLAP